MTGRERFWEKWETGSGSLHPRCFRIASDSTQFDGFPRETAIYPTDLFAVAVGADPEARKFAPASAGNVPEKSRSTGLPVTFFHAREDRDASSTSVPGSTTLTPVEVERIRIRAGPRGDRVEIVDRYVTAHAVVHSDRTEEVDLTLEKA